jgi:hypothetical protein
MTQSAMDTDSLAISRLCFPLWLRVCHGPRFREEVVTSASMLIEFVEEIETEAVVEQQDWPDQP